MRSFTNTGNHPFFNQRQLARNFVLLSFLLTFALTGIAQNVTLTYSTAGGHTLIVPPGVTSITVQTWGGGGGGGGGQDGRGGSGGGGGAYTSKTFTVIPGEQYNITVGVGGAGGDGSGGSAGDGGFSQVQLNGGGVIVLANGGTKGSQASATGGTGGAASVDPDATAKWKGGDGAGGATSGTGGGGGGSSAGTAADGNTATTSTGATAPTNGGKGGDGTGAIGGAGTAPGGGGAGGDDDDGDDGGAGGVGKVIIAYTDNTAPVVTNVTSSTGNATYSVGADINVTITFDEPVIVAGGTPRIQLETGTTDRYANYTGGSGTNTLTFTYTVVAGDNSSDLDYLSINALDLNSATIKDNANNNATLTLAAPAAAGSLGANKAIVIDTPAIITGVTSSPSTGAFKFGSPNIVVTITFNKAVTVVGTPTLTLETGTPDQVIDYSGGSGTTALTFTYVIQNTDNSTDLDYKATNSLTAGTSIKDAGNTDATLTLPAPGAAGSLGANSSIVIDNIIPTVSIPDLLAADDTGYKNDDNITKNTANITFTGTAEAGSTVKIYNNVTEIGSGTATGGNYSIDVMTLAAGDYTQINASATDAAGNESAPTAALTPQLTIDVTPPTTGQMTLNAVTPRTVSWTFDEPIRAFATHQVAAAPATFTMTGFTRSAGYRGIASQGYTESTKVGLLTSAGPSGTVWDASMTISYDDAAGNIYDVAGNALADITNAPVTDIVPPSLVTGLVLNPNDGVSKIVTFNLSESLKLAEGVATTGFSSSQGAISSQTYSGKGSTETITLVGGPWNDNVTFTYSNTGNVEDAGNNDLVLAAEPILLKSITTFSNNANTNYATTGNIVTVTFASSRTLTALPSVTIGGIVATVTPGSGPFTGPFTATVTMTVGVTEGIIPISITAQETGKTTTTTYTTDGSNVTFDKTPPAVTNVSFTSNGAVVGTDYYATTGDLVTLSFTIVENFVPVVTIGGSPVAPGNIFNDGFNNYTVTVSPNAFPQGLITFSIGVTDLANNTTTKTTTDNSTTVTFDNTPPTVTSITVYPSKINAYATSINGTTPQLNSNQADFLITFDDPVYGVSNNTINVLSTGTVNYSNNPSIIAVQSNGITSAPFGQPSKYWRVLYNNVSGAGLLKLEVYQFGDFNVYNVFGLPLSTGYANIPRPPGLEAPNTYTISLPQPINPVGLISTSTISDNSITVNWGSVTGATHYLAILTTNPTASVTDGTYVPNDNVFGDGIVVQNIVQGTNSATFNEPPANSAYNIIIYPYALSSFTTAVDNTAIDFNSTPSRISRSATIVKDGTFTYSSNIDYKLYVASGVDLERFSVSDGGASTFADGLPTILTGLTLNNITNSQNLSTLSLYDGATPVGVPVAVTGSSVTFSGLSFNVAEGTTKTLTVKGIFKTTVTDNQVISFNLSTVTASSTGSSQFLNTTPDIASNPTVDQNKIEVTASQLHITTPASSTTVGLNSPFTVVVQARDVNSNVDLDFEGAPKDITALTNASGATMFSTPVVVGQQFTDGVYTFPVDFKFTTGNNNDNVTLSMTAGGISTVAAPAPFTPTLTLQASSESAIVKDPTFTFTTNIPYESFPEAADLTNANSFEALRALLVDGSRTSFAYVSSFGSGFLTTSTDTDLQPNTDLDGAPTVLNSITIRVTNPANVRRIALFTNSGVQIGNEIAVDELKSVVNKDFVFSGSPLLTAVDDSQAEIRVKVSFWNDDAHVTDNNLVQVSIISTTLGAGSKFFNSPPYIAGVNGGLVTPLTVNQIEVTATSLDFVEQPFGYAGIDEPIDGTPGASPNPGGNTPIVHARDKFGVLDTDFSFTATVTAAATPKSVPTNFASGILDLSAMQYDIAGLGTLTVTSNGLSSDNQPWATSEPSNQVDVIHVTASLPQNPANGVVQSPSLKGGTSNIVIFGFDIYPDHSTSTEPELKGFSIIFDNSYRTGSTTIFKNFKVFESTNGVFAGSENVTTKVVGTTVDEAISPFSGGGYDLVKVTFPLGNYRSLAGKNKTEPITYFLVADIDATASLATPKMTPYLVDGGFNSPETNNYIETTIGSSYAVLQGVTYGFASTRPPTLIASEPANGELNVDSLQSTIKLYFDVGVWSHDQEILLWERYSNTLVDKLTLIGSNGFYPGAVTDPKAPAIPLTFAIPYPDKLVPDSVYYITIAKGTFDNNTKTGTGISDDGFNLYGGISFNGGLYFKIASKNPPVMTSTNSNKYYASATGASINASFDQKEGTAYYMVVNQGDPAPTNAIIKDPLLNGTYLGTIAARGQFSINQVDPNLNSGIFTVAPSGVSRTFDVWMYAENGAPIPVATKFPYGKLNVDADPNNDYIPGAAGPTLKVTIPAASANVYLNKPVYQICANSTVTLSDPIIIEESTARSEFTGGSQNFNILLPAGFSFDINTPPVIQTSGGVDFIGGTSYQFLNSTILRILFNNSGNLSQDKLIISNLRVTANATDLSGRIIRFAGNAFPTAAGPLGDGTILGSIGSGSATAFDFSNSYTTSNNFDLAPINITNPVTAIPDNYVDPDPNLNPFSVRLSPQVPKGDYGLSLFSGTGITNDVLNLTGVPLNTAFDITMKHVDMNGCVSNKVIQYEIYDHTQAIPALVDPTYGTKDFVINPGYLMGNPPPPFSNVGAEIVARDFKAGYSLIELFASIPAKAIALDTVTLLNNTASSQIMFGPAWETLVNQIPIVESLSPYNTTLAEYYRSYYWYYGVLLSDPTLDPYKYFDDFTPEGRKYFRGGSLGLVEFTGKFRSTADATVLIPIRQEIEIFVPAIPVVEINKSAISGFDNADPLKPDPNQWPDGTPIFCQTGAAITINGYPSATAGVSTGRFDIVDALNPLDTLYSSKIDSKRYGGFVDNGNGTALLTPSLLKNSAGRFANDFKDIRIVYTFKDNASPIAGSGELVIRVSPNPTAEFNKTSILLSDNIPGFTAATLNSLAEGRPSTTLSYCEDNYISFNNTSKFLDQDGGVVAGYNAKFNPVWALGDPTNSKNNRSLLSDPGSLTLADSVVMKYSNPGTYSVEFAIESQYGCRSTVYSSNITVGEIPVPNFGMTGVSTITPVVTTNATNITTTAVWNFGNPHQPNPELMVFNAANSYSYSTPGHYTITMKATSAAAGCEISYARPVIIVPSIVIQTNEIQNTDNFESSDPLLQWQTSDSTKLTSSWVRGVSAKDSLRLKTNLWITGTTADYKPGEESYLYSPVYDLTNLSRPMVSFDHAANLAINDGVALEFSVDNYNAADPLKKWYRLGAKDEGVNWYDKAGLGSKPGDQLKYPENIISSGDYGWSKKDTLSRSARHALSPDLPSKGQVAFRFALKSIEERAGDQGFAIDNFRVGDRTRTIVLENFTNKGTANPQEKLVSDALKAFIGPTAIADGEILKINYHVSFPGADPFNAVNPADPSARALYYNVTGTPTTFVDGFGDPIQTASRLFTAWGKKSYDERSLELAGANIEIIPTFDNASASYKVKVIVTANEDLPANTILHVGFLEENISFSAASIKTGETTFEYVLKKLLPTAAGSHFGTPLLKDDTRQYSFEWSPAVSKLFAGPDDLAVFAFLQDENSRTIHQSVIVTGLQDPPVVTGINEILPEQVNVYPNPASREFRVELPAIVQTDVNMYMVDQMGRRHESGMIKSGTNAAKVNVESLSEGIYILEIGSSEAGIIRKKIMVVMRN